MRMLGRASLPKNPIVARKIYLCAVFGLVAWPWLASAQAGDAASAGVLTEADVIELARARAPAAAVAAATSELADARARTAGLLPNPSINWGRETIQTGPAAGQGSQDILTASLPIDFARPLTARSLVAAQSAWMRAEASLTRTDAVAQVVLAYYDVVFAERHVEVSAQVLANLEEASRVLERREQAGHASGYESARLAVARELSRSRLAEVRGLQEGANQRFGAWLGLPPNSFRVAAEIALISESAAAALVRGRGESRRAMRQARESARLAADAADRADWAWLPTLELAGGMKRASNLGAASGYGYVFGVSLGVPWLDHGQAQRAQARAQRTLALARAEALTRTIDADIRRAHASFLSARREQARFDAQTLGKLDVLLAAAQSGYREGERTVLELLDAQRAQADVAERRLSLLDMAKRAEVRLRAAAGDLR